MFGIIGAVTNDVQLSNALEIFVTLLGIIGAVRGVVATLTPEQVQGDKEAFKEAIVTSVST